MTAQNQAESAPLPSWIVDLGIGGVTFLIGMAELFDRNRDGAGFLLVLSVAAAVGFFRRAPGIALSLACAATFLHLVLTREHMLLELGLALVAFGTARYGSRLVVWASAVWIPMSLALMTVKTISFGRPIFFTGFLDLGRILRLTPEFGYGSAVLAFVIVLVVPWFIGLTLRGRAQSEAKAKQAVEALAQAEKEREAAESQRDQAEEIAELRDGQARLARDVHDVVGHSLAVILAQAESARYLPDDGPDQVQDVMDNIATSARRSLQDVRQVLTSTADNAPAPATDDLESLIEGVRSSGHEVLTSVTGTARPLPPEMATVSYRVLQEMLTNALKHGVREAPVEVAQHWADELRLSVRNRCATETTGKDGAMGIVGMERRLASIGGRLEVTRTAEPDGTEAHLTTAWIPMRNPESGDDRAPGDAGETA